MSDPRERPSGGLVPDPEGEQNLHRLADETPDTFGEPRGQGDLENLPKDELEDDLARDPVAEDLATNDENVPDPEDAFLEDEDTEYTEVED